MFVSWSKNKKAPYPYCEKILNRQDGATLEQDESGLLLILHIESPTEKEIATCEKDKIESAYFEDGPFWLGQIRFRNNKNMSFDFPFDIGRYPIESHSDRFEQLSKTNLLMVVLVDRDNCIVKTIRAVSMPKMFRDSLYQSVRKQLSEDDAFSEQYNIWIDKLYAKYTPPELWEISMRSGNFGE